MAPGGRSYILRNFPDHLTWKTLHFVDCLPPAQMCSACGIVDRRIGSLTCGHFVCEPCYQQLCELSDPPRCVFDGEACPEESFEWRDFPAENLLKRQIMCCNKVNGCNVVMAAVDLPGHLSTDCEHHLVSCRECSAKILWSGLCSHLRSCTGNPEPEATASAQVAGCNQQATELTALAASLSATTKQMKQQITDLARSVEENLVGEQSAN